MSKNGRSCHPIKRVLRGQTPLRPEGRAGKGPRRAAKTERNGKQ